MLKLEQVHTYYGESHILQGISLTVEAGEIVGLLGRNGVGKTTTIRTIANLTPLRRGNITFLDRSIGGRPSYEVAQLGMGLVPQGRRIFSELTVTENLRIAARPQSEGWTIERIFSLFPRLQEREAQYGASLSGGEQQMLAIGRALVGNPRLLLMDEPSEGLAPLIIQEVKRVILELKEMGLSIFLVEQNLPLALSVTDRVYVLAKGQIVYTGTPSELEKDEEVKSRYLGVGIQN